MKILVTGIGGFIGNYLYQASVNAGYDVIGLFHRNKPDIKNLGNSTLIEHNLKYPLEGIDPVNIIIHTAARTHLMPNSTVKKYLDVNSYGTFHLAEYAKKSKVQLVIYLSTVSLYGNITVPELKESTPLNEPEAYGLSKYLGELILKENSDYFPTTVFRMPGILGKGNFAPWLGHIFKRAVNHDTITIYNQGSLFNNLFDLSELWKIISRVININFQDFDSFNLGASSPITVQSVVDQIRTLTKSNSRVTTKENGKNSFWINIDKMKNILGYIPDTTSNMVERFVAANYSENEL